MPKAVKGVLVKCDPSIKAIILQIESKSNEYIIEDLDEEVLLVKESKVDELKRRLKEMLKDTVKDDSDAESGDE